MFGNLQRGLLLLQSVTRCCLGLTMRACAPFCLGEFCLGVAVIDAADGNRAGQDRHRAEDQPGRRTVFDLRLLGGAPQTTARSLIWMFYLLSRDDESRARVQNEIRAIDLDALPVEQWEAAMPFASAVIKETLRLYPTASNIMRVALSDGVIAGHQIKPGTDVVVSPWVLHRHRALWRDPDVFDPNRFLPPDGDTIDRFAYLPFGAGPRVCIGAKFAIQEMLIVLVEFLSRFEFDYDNAAEPKPVLRFTIKPMEEIYMRIRTTPDIPRTNAA